MSRVSRAAAAAIFTLIGLLAAVRPTLFPAGNLAGQPALAAPAAAPTKRTEKVAMADGTRLATDIYLPAGSGPFPVVLGRTPYNKDAIGGMAQAATQRGYAVVVQDTRGRFASEGDNLPFEGDDWVASRRDGHDTVEWIARQPWSNGKIGTFGGSAGAITQMGLATSAPPHLVCQHLVVGSASFYRDGIYPGGVFKKAMIEDWLKGTNHRADSLQRWVAHPTYDDFWRERDLARRWDRVNVPAVHIGGWYDIFAQGVIDAFLGYQTKGGPNARGRQKLVMGPWTHGVLTTKAGEFTYPENASRPPNNVHDMWRWFDHWLAGRDNGVEREPAVTYYVMGDVTTPGAPGNTWRTTDRWPVPARDTKYYLNADPGLSTSMPSEGNALSYRYDPNDPVPTTGGTHLTLPAGPREQSGIERRPDVLVFTSAPLSEPLEVTGRVRARLWASSDAADTDFTAKLCDVYPDGRSFNVVDGILRARFRESPSRERLLEPGRVYRFDIDLWSTSIVFNKGHRLRVQIASSNAPGYDPNPNTGEAFRAGTTTRVARNTIYVDRSRPSHLTLPIPATTAGARP